jgi:hypothetical protein
VAYMLQQRAEPWEVCEGKSMPHALALTHTAQKLLHTTAMRPTQAGLSEHHGLRTRAAPPGAPPAERQRQARPARNHVTRGS